MKIGYTAMITQGEGGKQDFNNRPPNLGWTARIGPQWTGMLAENNEGGGGCLRRDDGIDSDECLV
jgi:hypothetical protein